MKEMSITKRPDGTFEEQLDGKWLAIYAEDPLTGYFSVEIFFHDVVEWAASEFASLEEAQQAAHEYYDNEVY